MLMVPRWTLSVSRVQKPNSKCRMDLFLIWANEEMK